MKRQIHRGLGPSCSENRHPSDYHEKPNPAPPPSPPHLVCVVRADLSQKSSSVQGKVSVERDGPGPAGLQKGSVRHAR